MAPPPPPPPLPPAPVLRLPPPPPIEDLFTTNDIIKKQFTDCGETNNFHRLTRAGDIQGLKKLAETNPELVNSRGRWNITMNFTYSEFRSYGTYTTLDLCISKLSMDAWNTWMSMYSQKYWNWQARCSRSNTTLRCRQVQSHWQCSTLVMGDWYNSNTLTYNFSNNSKVS